VTAPLTEIASLVRTRTGMVISESQLPALAASVGRVAAGMEPSRFVRELAAQHADGPLFAALVDQVTVNETYFFREMTELRAIDWPRLLQAARSRGADAIRVWVSACATGEEAYTFAILASEALGSSRPPVTITATDVSHAAIARAEAGRYTERALRNVPADLRARYLVRETHRRSVVASPTRSLVRFCQHNLLEGPMPPAGEAPFDIVSCRNLLIYFDDATAEQVIGAFDAALLPAGTLILGAADRLAGTTRRLARASRPAADRRRPLGLGPAPPAPRDRTEDRIDDALGAADAGDLDTALTIIDNLLTADPMDVDAFFVRGLALLASGDADGAANALRSALYIDPAFGLAAFQLGRAQEAKGDAKAARRAYERALRTLDPPNDRHHVILDKVDLGDIAAACRARLAA
jgi:chemotaxis protein methyltransferase WspC